MGDGGEIEGRGGELVVGGEGEGGGEAIETHSGEEGWPSSRLQLGGALSIKTPRKASWAELDWDTSLDGLLVKAWGTGLIGC